MNILRPPRNPAPVPEQALCREPGCTRHVFVNSAGRRMTVCHEHWKAALRAGRKAGVVPDPAPEPPAAVVVTPAPLPAAPQTPPPLVGYVGPRFCSACHTAYPATDRHWDLSKDRPRGLLNWTCRHCDGTYDPARPHVREVVPA